MSAVLVLHGPNLNLLGSREPEVYGTMSLNDIDQKLVKMSNDLGLDIRTYQSNSEGDLIDALHDAREWASGIIFNPGGYTHSSIALRDAVSAIEIPVIEVHLSNVYDREEFRHKSLISPVCTGKILGFGWRSYTLALNALNEIINEQP